MTVARALGKVLDAPAEAEEDQETPLCFTLDLYHPAPTAWGSGRFLTDIGRRRRSGGGGVVAAEDRWMTETARRPGEIIVPRLRWARRTEGADPRPSHLSVAFDVFMPNLQVRPEADLAKPRPIHAYGLVNVIERRVDLQGDLEWLAYAPPALDGGRAPENRSATDRFLRLSTAIARATAQALGGDGHGRQPTRALSRSGWAAPVGRS